MPTRTCPYANADPLAKAPIRIIASANAVFVIFMIVSFVEDGTH
jgi:hypothetical protein